MSDINIQDLVPAQSDSDGESYCFSGRRKTYFRGTIPGNRLNKDYDFEGVHHINPYEPSRPGLTQRRRSIIRISKKEAA